MGTSVTKDVMTIEEVAQYLDLSVGTIYNKVDLREIPFARVGKVLRFPKRAIDEWLAENVIPPRPSVFEEFSRLFSRYHFKQWLESKGVEPAGLTDEQLLKLAKKAIEDLKNGSEPNFSDQEPRQWRKNGRTKKKTG